MATSGNYSTKLGYFSFQHLVTHLFSHVGVLLIFRPTFANRTFVSSVRLLPSFPSHLTQVKIENCEALGSFRLPIKQFCFCF